MMSVTAEKLHIVKQVDHIPSRKFIPLVYQIASRLSIPDVPGISPEQKHFRTSIHDVRQCNKPREELGEAAQVKLVSRFAFFVVHCGYFAMLS